MIKTRKHRPDNLLPNVLSELGQLAERIDTSLQSLRRPTPILPADVGKQLLEAMVARQNVLEDARYFKVAPNDYQVELNEANYHRYYQPVEKLVCEQWRERLLEALNTTNCRQGRKEYRFGGRVCIRIQPVTYLSEDEVCPSTAGSIQRSALRHRYRLVLNCCREGNNGHCEKK